MHQDKPRRHNSKKLHLDAFSTNLELRSYDFSLSNQTSRFSERSFKRSSSIHDLFTPEHKKDFRLSCIATLSTDYDNRDHIDECKVVFLDDDREREILSFETNQNSRNSQRENSSVKDVTTIMDLLEDRAKSSLDISPDTQNKKNARLSLEYEKRLRSQSVLDVTNSKTMFVKSIARTNSIESKFITIDRTPFSMNILQKDTFSSASSLLPPRPLFSASFSSCNPDGQTTPDSTRLTSKNSAYNTLYAYQDHDDLCVLQIRGTSLKRSVPC
ncbi:uncharacterized protein LOC124422022 [Vespa crabro]|uniref:uncharacterized protein LOC124422022 n=1 Tax=Vespa crabro TaxID=7445 RepID=UPI001F011AE9|nr:uncharacterized protein LOC124422022 [Vespa crabro]